MIYRPNTIGKLYCCTTPELLWLITLPCTHSSYTDFGHFITGMLVVAGFAEPLLFSHAKLVEPAACWMSMIGGGLIYGTILTYAGLFDEGKGYDF